MAVVVSPVVLVGHVCSPRRAAKTQFGLAELAKPSLDDRGRERSLIHAKTFHHVFWLSYDADVQRLIQFICFTGSSSGFGFSSRCRYRYSQHSADYCLVMVLSNDSMTLATNHRVSDLMSTEGTLCLRCDSGTMTTSGTFCEGHDGCVCRDCRRCISISLCYRLSYTFQLIHKITVRGCHRRRT